MMKFLISQVIKSFEVQRASQKILLRTTEPSSYPMNFLKSMFITYTCINIHMLRFRRANRSELFT